MRECRPCAYTSAIHRETVERELARLRSIASIAPADAETVHRRLTACSACRYLDHNHVCLMCGCYVQIRTFARDARCPAKTRLW